jgi:hypothetical protein
MLFGVSQANPNEIQNAITQHSVGLRCAQPNLRIQIADPDI